jgi:uncharacterized protein YcfJ
MSLRSPVAKRIVATIRSGVVGNPVQMAHQDKNATYTTERRCHQEQY